MPTDSTPSRLERTIIGREESTYRQLVRAITIVTVALVIAWLFARLGLFGIDPALAGLFGTAAGVAVSAYVVMGMIQFVVLARAYDRGATEVAQTAKELEEAADTVAKTADELDETAETVEKAVEHVDEVTEQVGNVSEQVDEAVEQASEAKQKTDEAKDTADSVKETVEKEKEHLLDADEEAEA